jgi:tetratricopeptide (TPR) repeat protein
VAASGGLLAGCRGELPVLGLDEVQRSAAGLLASRPALAEPESGGTRKPAGETPLPPVQPDRSGAGIVITDPVCRPLNPQLSRFGAGCTRWLQFEVGGQPQLGRTPMMAELYQHWTECRRRGTGPEPEVVLSRVGGMGATHVAMGEISGSAQDARLSYRLWKLADRSSVGEPILLTGSLDAVKAKLPELGRELSRRLGVDKPTISEDVVESPEELQFLGSFYPQGHEQIGDAALRQLETLAFKSGAASMMHLLGHIAAGGPGDHTLGSGHTFVTRYPNNTQAWLVGMMAGSSFGRGVDPGKRKALRELVARYPSNWALLEALLLQTRMGRAQPVVVSTGGWPEDLKRQADAELAVLEEERLLAERGVACSPTYSYAWQELGEVAFATSDRLRHGRPWDQVPPERWERLRALYAKWLEGARKAAQLSPDDTDMWVFLSRAAKFAGQNEEAERALDRALAVPQGEYRIYHWGQEMFRPKWGAQPEKRRRIVRLAAADPYLTSESRFSMAQALVTDYDAETVRPLLRSEDEREWFDQQLRERRQRQGNPRMADAPPPSSMLAPPVTASKPVQAPASASAPAPPQAPSSPSGNEGVPATPPGSATAPAPAVVTGPRPAVPSAAQLALSAAPRAERPGTAPLPPLPLPPTTNVQRIRPLPPADGQVPPQARRLAVQPGGVFALAWSPDGNRLAAGGYDGRLQLWSSVEQEPVTLATAKAPLLALAWSPDSRRLASAGYDGVIRFWDAGTGKLEGQIDGHRGLIWSLTWSPDGKRLVSGGNDGALRFWDPQTRSRARDGRQLAGPVRAVRFSPNGKWLACYNSGVNPTLSLLDPDTGAERRVLDHTSRIVSQIAWSPSSRKLGITTGRVVAVWDAEKEGEPNPATPFHSNYAALDVVWDSDERDLLMLWGDHRAYSLDLETATGTKAPVLNNSEATKAVRFAWDSRGERLVTGAMDGTLLLWSGRSTPRHRANR